MARKPNYSFEKRKKEMDRRAKKDAKREDRRQRRDARESEDVSPAAPEGEETASPDLERPAD